MENRGNSMNLLFINKNKRLKFIKNYIKKKQRIYILIYLLKMINIKYITLSVTENSIPYTLADDHRDIRYPIKFALLTFIKYKYFPYI